MPDIKPIDLIKKYELRPRKSLGQHFLVELPTIRKIVKSVNAKKDDVILEIGCGPGIITPELSQTAKNVIAIDIDTRAIDAASNEWKEYKNIDWILADILSYDLEGIAKNDKLIIAGNLPYNISSKILFWMIKNRKLIKHAVVMLQKDVAVRICSKSGNKNYGILSVMTQALSTARVLFDVGRHNFYPPPDVISSIISLNFNDDKNQHEKIENYKNFSNIVRAAFGMRRKMIRNALIGSTIMKLKKETVDTILKEAYINPKCRPENVEVDEFITLSNCLTKISHE